MRSSQTRPVSMQSICCQASSANCERRRDLSTQGFQTTARQDLLDTTCHYLGGEKALIEQPNHPN